jgi:protein-S-isoprenylcysteine O-methyltransferase
MTIMKASNYHTVAKLLFGVCITAVIVVVPTLGNKAFLHAPPLWILIAVGSAASFYQPSYNPFKPAPDKQDRGTACQIIWSIYLTQICMLIEAAYYRYPDCIVFNGFTVTGLCMMVTGLFIRTWAYLTLGAYFTWHITVQKDQNVIKTGPYALVRHPGYFGAFITYVGTTVFLHAWGTLFLAVIFLSYAFYRRIHYEEMELHRILGKRYKEYSCCVKQFIPWIW